MKNPTATGAARVKLVAQGAVGALVKELEALEEKAPKKPACVGTKKL
jgi:hypothetical protein